jgi:hypothetical protein
MSQSTDSIVKRFVRYVERCGGPPDQWYVGVTGDARKRLFRDHGIREKNDAWFYARAVSSSAAREVRRRVMESLGIENDDDAVEMAHPTAPGLLSALSDIVYAYKKGPHTKP